MTWGEAELAGLFVTLMAWLILLLVYILKTTIEPPSYMGHERRLLSLLIREGQMVEEYEDALDRYEDDWWKKCDFKNQKELADMLGVSQAAITRYVNKLQGEGLIRVVSVKGSNFPLAWSL